jgi:glutaredoxin
MSRKKYHLVIQESCSYCQQAVVLLDQKGKLYTLDTMDDEEPKLLVEIKKKWNHSTTPLIWEIDQLGRRTFIGGYSELVQYFLREDKRLFHD